MTLLNGQRMTKPPYLDDRGALASALEVGQASGPSQATVRGIKAEKGFESALVVILDAGFLATRL